MPGLWGVADAAVLMGGRFPPPRGDGRWCGVDGGQVESHLARVHGGSGLGLVLLKGLVEGIGGTLTFTR
jgi:hypothetical protein